MSESGKETLYNAYSTYLKDKYGGKVRKLTVNLPATCPNRDGTLGFGGCHFCSDKGAGFESLPSTTEVKEQLAVNMERVGKKFKTSMFIAYFQNYTNTYMPYDTFEAYMRTAVIDNVVELDVATRPDCIDEKYLQILKDIQTETGVAIVIELGLQTTNEESLIKINRGHDVSAYIDAVKQIHSFGFAVCTHLIMNLPWDEDDEVVRMACLMNELNVEMIKCHSLYIAKGTEFEKQYLDGVWKMNSRENYVDRVITFLSYLSPECAVQRLVGRAPEKDTVFCNWNTSWWKIKDQVEEKMLKEGIYQGKMLSLP